MHCCTALGYALVLSGVLVVYAAWLATWAWVIQDDRGVTSVRNDSLASLVAAMTCAYTLSTYFNVANAYDSTLGGARAGPIGARTGPIFARWALVVGAVIVPAYYGWLWALEHAAGVNAWYSLVHPPSAIVFSVLFILMDTGGRNKWSKKFHNRRKLPKPIIDEGGEGAVQVVPQTSPRSASCVDTAIALVTAIAGISIQALCECSSR